MTSLPSTVAADAQGRIVDLPGLAAAGRSGRAIYPLDPESLIPLPKGSPLYLLPARRAVGFAPGSNAPKSRSATLCKVWPRQARWTTDPLVPATIGTPEDKVDQRLKGNPDPYATLCKVWHSPFRLGNVPTGERIVTADPAFTAVAAFLPPGYTTLALAAFEGEAGAPLLPLYSYSAVCWYRGRFCVPAIRVDRDPKHDPSRFDPRRIEREVRCRIQEHPDNRLMAHHGRVCALRYGCPNAANLFLRRWEAPVAVSGGCNASCQGCISEQPASSPIRPPQERIGFVPTVEEIVELAVPHLEQAPRAMISFGQGCEGEPLLHGSLIEKAIRAIRLQTNRGTIHINTNGSRPAVVARLIDAGLDSIRVSLNSARAPLYAAYYRCRGYGFRDVLETLRVARDNGLWISLNYLTFPGVTDDEAEFRAFRTLLAETRPDMIQWRNLNIDPDAYMDTVDRAVPSRCRRALGLASIMLRIRRDFPTIRFGYFNPPVRRRSR